MLLLLSPAKTMDPNRPEDVPLSELLSTPILLQEATAILDELKSWSLRETQVQLKLSENLAIQVHDWHKSWRPFGQAAAGWTFRGDAFKSLDLPSLPHDTLLIAQRRLCILHGVYGLLRPLDRFMLARLEMAQRWCHDPKFNSMAAFWKLRLPGVVDHAANALGSDSIILNLASAEYGDVALHGIPPDRILTCIFLENRKGQLKSISSYSKAARGAMARHVLLHNISSPRELENFTELDYAYSPEKSTTKTKVFVRTLTP